MFTITCPDCSRAEVPLNECYRIGEHLKCANCAERESTDGTALKDVDRFRLADMNTCAFCGKHPPEVIMKNMSGSPVCQACSQNIISRPFPLWVKAFFAGVVLLVFVSIIWNWRYFNAYGALSDVKAAFEQGDLDAAIAGVDVYQSYLPESQDLYLPKRYWQGIRSLGRDSSAAAVMFLEEVESLAPGEFDTDELLLRARMGKAYDEQDYTGFLDYARQSRNRYGSSEASVLGSVASAFACLYATTSDDVFKDSAMHLLDQARVLGDTAFSEYEGRILYRLHSKEIITRQAYYERFPNGWKP